MVEIVNMVGSGATKKELDLEQLVSDIGEPVAKYNPEKYPGLYLQFDDDGPLITLYRTGKFIITGASSEAEINKRRELFLGFLSEQNIIELPIDDEFAIQNVVCVAEISQTEDVNLSALAIGLGLESTEYEPEQFPGLIYIPGIGNCICLFFFLLGR